MKLIALLAILTASAGAQSRWPAGLSASISGPCVMEQDGRHGKERIARASGTLDVAPGPEGTWTEVEVLAFAHVAGPRGERDLTATTIIAISATMGVTKPFVTGFDHSLLSDGEEVTACGATFHRGARIVRRPALVTASTTPLAKDKECLADLARADSLEGLERRKRLAELFQYGCVTAIPPTTIVTVLREFDSAGTPAIAGEFSELGGDRKWFGLTLRGYLTTEKIPVKEEVKSTALNAR